jgi:tetratricopeptide (TPR) repeat protein
MAGGAGVNRARKFPAALLIFVLALAVRFLYLYEISRSPTFRVPILDSYAYDRMARTFAQQGSMGLEFFWQPFFYQFFLAVVYFFSAGSILCAKIVQLVLGALTCVLTYKLGSKVFSRKIGFIAAVIVVFYGPLIFFEAELLASGWATFWAVVLVLLFLKAEETPSYLYWLLVGLCGGLGVIIRPEFGIFFIVAFVWLGVKSLKRQCLSAGKVAAAVAGVLLIVVPVGMAGRYVTGRFTVLPVSGGINFYIGNNPDYCQTLTIRPGTAWKQLICLPSRYGVGPDEHDRDRFFKREVIEYAQSNPAAFAYGLARKVLVFVSSREIPRNLDLYMFSKWSRVLGFLAWKWAGFGFPFGVIFPMAVCGLLWWHGRIRWPLILFLLFYPLSIILVFVAARYKLPIVPVLAVPAAAGLATAANAIRRRNWRTLARMAVVVAAMVALSCLPGPFCEENVNFEAEYCVWVGDELAGRGQTQKALAYYNDALQLQPDFAQAHYSLGMLLAGQGRLAEAAEHYQKAVESYPEFPEAHHGWAVALWRLNKPNQAIEHFRTALEQRPEYPESLQDLGAALAQQGKLDEAAEHFERLVRLQPRNLMAYRYLSLALAGQRKMAEAIRYYEIALNINSNFPPLREELARMCTDYALSLVQQGRLDQAVPYWTRAVQLKDELVEVHNYLAWFMAVDEKAGFHDPARAALHGERACQLTGYKQADVLDSLAVAYAASGEFLRAVETAQKALQVAQDTGQQKLAEGIRQRLELFQSQRPYRERLPVAATGR